MLRLAIPLSSPDHGNAYFIRDLTGYFTLILNNKFLNQVNILTTSFLSAMHDTKTTSLDCFTENNQDGSPKSPRIQPREKLPAPSSPNQSVTVWGLAVAVGSLGAIFTAPQIAQAAIPNLSVDNYYSSTINLGTDSATTVTVPQLPSLSVAQNFTSKTITKQIYTVRKGDTLNSIASEYGITTDEIMQANNLENSSQLAVNDRLIIPLKQSSQVSTPSTELNEVAQNSAAVSFAVRNPIGTKASSTGVQPLVAQNVRFNTTNNQQNVRELYTSRLRADIDKLRHQFQNQYRDEKSSVPANGYSLVTKPESLEPDYYPSSNSSVEQQAATITSDNSSSSAELVISSAISPIDNYSPLSSSPVTERLQPKLPPLSSPEEYLPNFFNGYIWPAQGTFTSGYGWRWGRMHRGIDIAAPIGTPIVAAATGEVIFAGWNSGGFGNLVKVKHPDGSVTLYAHNNRILVRRGQRVKQGQQIAEMGSTGFSTGPHLHFEIRTDGKTAINPIALLPKK